MVIQSLIIFGQRSDLEQLLEEETITHFVVEALENLSLTTLYDSFKEVFFRFLPNLVLDVGLNLIKTTELERLQMVEDPAEFVGLALDTCDKQQSYVIKTQAAKLFEGLCDNIDGAVTVTSYFCIQAINMTLSRESPKAMVELDNFAANIDDAHRNLIENCSFIKNSKPDVIVESGIVVLALLSYVHSKQAYTTIFLSIEKVFTHFIDEIINNESKLIRVRYSLFLGYLIDVLFKKEPNAFRDTILFLYTTVDLVGDDKAIACQSIDTLKTVVCDNDLQPRVIELNLIPVLVEKIQGSIATIQNHEYMDFVNDFLASYAQLVDDKAICLANAVV